MLRPHSRRGIAAAIAPGVAALLLATAGTAALAQDTPTDGDDVLAGKTLAWVSWGNDSHDQAQYNWFTKLAEEAGATVQVYDGAVDPSVQVRHLADLVAAGVDGIAYQPVEPQAAVTSVQEVQAAGIPLFFIGYRTDPESGVVAPAALYDDAIGVRQAGRNAGTWLQENRPGEPAKVVIFDILTLPLCKEGRMDNFLGGLAEVLGEENVEIKFRDTVDHVRDVSQARMEDLLQVEQDFNVFTACGADGVLGGIAALQAAGRAQAVDKVPVTEYIFTIDGTPSELELLFDPTSSVMETYTLTPRLSGVEGVEGLRKLISGEYGPTDDIVVPLPGSLLPPDCAEVAVIFEEQYGLNSAYQPLQCD